MPRINYTDKNLDRVFRLSVEFYEVIIILSHFLVVTLFLIFLTHSLKIDQIDFW